MLTNPTQGGMSQSLNPWRIIINLVKKPFSIAYLWLQNLLWRRESVTAHCLQQSSQISFINYWIWLKWAELNKAELIASVAKIIPRIHESVPKRTEKKWAFVFRFRNENRITSQQLNWTSIPDFATGIIKAFSYRKGSAVLSVTFKSHYVE